MRYLCLLLSALILPASLAQDVSEEMEVLLRKVTVRVVDNKNRPVTGLTQNDFTLRNHGEKVKIVSFEAPVIDPQTQQPAPADQPKFLAILFDTAMIAKRDFPRTKMALLEYIETRVPKDTKLSLTITDMYKADRIHFTTDHESIKEAIRKTTESSQMRVPLDRYQGMIHKNLGDIDDAAQGNRNRAFTSFFIPGDAVQGMRLKSWDRSEAFSGNLAIAMEKKVNYKARHFYTFLKHLETMGNTMPSHESEKGILIVSGGTYAISKPERLLDWTADMSAQGVTIHAIMVRGKALGGFVKPNGDNDFASTTSVRHTVTLLEHGNQMSAGLEEVSEKTGGVIYEARINEDLGKAFANFEKRRSSYYTFWYESTTSVDEPRIKLRNSKNRRLTYSRRIGRKPKYNDLEDDARKHAFMTTLRFGSDTGDGAIPATWSFNPFHQNDRYQYTVGASMANFVEAAQYEIATALLDENRNILAMTHRIVNLPQQDFSFFEQIGAVDRPTILSCTIRNLDTDKINQKVFNLTPPKDLKQPRISGLALTAESKQTLYAQFLGQGTTPCQIKGQKLPCVFGQSLKRGSELGVFIRLDNTKTPHDWNGTLTLKGRNRTYQTLPLLTHPEAEQVTFYYSLSANTLGTDDYTLEFMAEGPDGQLLKRAQHFEIAATQP